MYLVDCLTLVVLAYKESPAVSFQFAHYLSAEVKPEIGGLYMCVPHGT